MNKEKTIIPEYLEYLGIKYKYNCNKGGLLCYTYTPGIHDTCHGETIIIEHRKEKRLSDQFYVLFQIVGCNGYDWGYTQVNDLSGYTRQAKPIFKL